MPVASSSSVAESDIKNLSKSFNIVSVSLFGAENARQVKISDILKINLENLEFELQEQAKEYTWWAQVAAKTTAMLAELKSDKEKAEIELKREYARLSTLAKSPHGIRLGTPDAKKPTVDEVENWVLSHPDYIEAQSKVWLIGRQIIEMEHTVAVYTNMYKGFKMKGKMLECLYIKNVKDGD